MRNDYLELLSLALRSTSGKRKAISEFLRLVGLDRKVRRHGGAGQDNEERAIKVRGATILGYGYASLDHLYKEIYLRNDYAVELPTARPIIVDCGSNIGMSILYFKHRYPESTIIGFEPNPDVHALLLRNIEANGLGGVTTHAVALSDREGVIPFFLNGNKGTLRSSARSDRGGDRQVECRTVRLSDQLAEIPRVDLIKIDVEGSESAIVREMAEAGALRKADHYLVEYHLNIGGDRSDLSSFLRLFEDNGYSYKLRAENQRRSRFQDILVHFFKEEPSPGQPLPIDAAFAVPPGSRS